MPNYDFRCKKCHKRFSVYFSYSDYGTVPVKCVFCHSTDVTRLINRIRIAHSQESRLDNFSDPSELEGLEDDPRTLGRMMREMSHETGEELGPEFDEVVDRLEKGQDPDEIAESMPDLADEE